MTDKGNMVHNTQATHTQKPPEQEKIPGKFARAYMRVQAGMSIATSVLLPFYAVYSAMKGRISIPFGVSTFKIDISSPQKRAATVIGGLLYAAYSGVNGFARLRTAKDTATREKISLGELEPENALFNSSTTDRTLTKVEASVSTAIAVSSLGYALHTAMKDNSSTKTGSLIFATGSAMIAGIMSVVKFRAANAAEKHAQEIEALQQRASSSHYQEKESHRPQPTGQTR